MSPENSKGGQGISLPKGGGAIQGIGETFQPDLFSGTGSFSIPIAMSPGRDGFGPQLTLQYSAGNGNSPFGLGWQLSIPRISRKTEKGLPKYDDGDVFVMSGAEDLVPCLQMTEDPDNLDLKRWIPHDPIYCDEYTVTRYRPRTEGLFARIEKWVRNSDGDIHWRATSKNNVISIYGRSRDARIADPGNENHVFEWLLQETLDAKGNHILYEYARDDTELTLETIDEEHRTYCQLYIRRIYFGNLPDSLLDQDGNPICYADGSQIGPEREGLGHIDQVSLIQRRYAFEVVFDYDDWPLSARNPYREADPLGKQELFGPNPSGLNTNNEVPIRQDRFSTHRSGFEIRTLRLCHHVLMFHHFQELGGPTLIRSTDLEYDINPDTHIAFLAGVTITGYHKLQDGYQIRSMPPATFKYSEFEPFKQRYQSVNVEGNSAPPLGLRNPEMAMVDFLGNGLPDFLHATPTGFRYWENLGNGVLDRPRDIPYVPAGVSLSQSGVALADMAGDGRADLLVITETLKGFFETAAEGTWKTFRHFETLPSVDLSDPNVRMLDLTGNGLTDILETRDHHFLWFECQGERGYVDGRIINRKHDLADFPDVYFDDPSGRVRLADLSGDGLKDIVLLHSGRVDYWPNLGYGHFGKRITMAHSPKLESDYDPSRLFLADIDGSGCADLVYVDFDKTLFWFNRSGNSWSNRHTICGTPVVNDSTSIDFGDFFGTGTTAAIWSYDYHRQHKGNYKVLDFCGGVKPYVLTEMNNNMGASTHVRYASSTKYYLEDEEDGVPWLTMLPFPVQVVDKVETIDHISKTKLVTTYKYHHGYFDGNEREFRGFGRVDQFDTEVFDEFAQIGLHDHDGQFENNGYAYHAPPVETRTWFHTGIYFDQAAAPSNGAVLDYRLLTNRYKQEFYQDDLAAWDLADHKVDIGATPHDAYRALRGATLRSEVYSADGTDEAQHPYAVTQNRYLVKQLQPGLNENRACYSMTQFETMVYHYERCSTDPRISHTINLDVDEFGNVTDSVSIAYPRRKTQWPLPEQRKYSIIYTKTDFINSIDSPEFYYVGIPYQKRDYEVLGIPQTETSFPLNHTDFALVMSDPDDFLPYELQPEIDYPSPGKRIIEWSRDYLRKNEGAEQLDENDNLENRLRLGEIDSLGLPYESYQAAMTGELIEDTYDCYSSGNPRVTDEILKEGGYRREPDVHGYWWIPSGQQSFRVDAFYLPDRSRDPFGNTSHVTYDAYGLLPVESVDPVGNIVQAQNDYHVLQPCLVVDPNGNRAAAEFDALGMVMATAVMGKAGENLGDLLEGFDVDPPIADIQSFVQDPLSQAPALLGNATTRIVYDLERFYRDGQPPFAATLARETHFHDPGGPDTKIQISFSYSDGFGREIQKKVQAEPGTVPRRGDDVRIVVGLDGQPEMEEGDNLRWVGTGWTIFNNKGKPVRQYEPFFTDTHDFEYDVKIGVSPVLFYDPMDRVVATLHPNNTWEKVVFDPWHQETWDVNDTVLVIDPMNDPDVGGFFQRLPESSYLPSWHALRTDPAIEDAFAARYPDATQRTSETQAARKTQVHAATPTVAHVDSLGRNFLTIAHNRFKYSDTPQDEPPIEEFYQTRIVFDIEGNEREVIDAKDRVAMRYDYDMLGNPIHQASMEAGDRWTLLDVAGNPIRAWDSREFTRRMTYDELRRPIGLYVTEDDVERLAERTVYGEGQGDKKNHRGRVYQVYDGAGVVTSLAYDFKGNLLAGRRELLPDYQEGVDWNQNPEPNDGTYISTTTFDALNRPSTTTTPDGSVYRPTYNEANFLEKVNVNLRSEFDENDQRVWTIFVSNIDYDAKGQRTRIDYGNGAVTTYAYDDLTYQLIHLRTTRPPGHNGLAPIFADSTVVQDLHYTYDPVGNITCIADNALKTVFHNNQEVKPVSYYTYDSIYRLIEAMGREHTGQMEFGFEPPNGNYRDHPFTGLNAHPNDLQSLRNYTQRYEYDEVGNFTLMHHLANGGSWKQHYEYEEDSLIEPDLQSNRLTRTRLGDGINRVQPYTYDQHGNMTSMPHLPAMVWDFEDQLQATARQVRNNGTAETTYYVYDAAGERVRKVTENPYRKRVKERIYLGGFEIYREFNGDGSTVTLERETLHVMNDQQRIALVETQTVKDSDPADECIPRQRCQLSNHLGSTCLELDAHSTLISYEEYHPYGTTAFQVMRDTAEVGVKRFRYTGKERDEENGLYYHGERCYGPWPARWISADPAGVADGSNLYSYTCNNPIVFSDDTGQYRVSKVKGRTSAVGEKIVELFRDPVLRKKVLGKGRRQGSHPGINIRLKPFGPFQKTEKRDPNYLKPYAGEGKGYTYCVAATWMYALRAIQAINKEKGHYGFGKITRGNYKRLARFQALWYRAKGTTGTTHGGFGAPQAIVEMGLGYYVKNLRKELLPGAVINLYGSTSAPEHGPRGPRLDVGTSAIFLEYGKRESLWDQLTDIWRDDTLGFFSKLGNAIVAVVGAIWDWVTGTGDEGIWTIHQGKEKFYPFEQLENRKAKAANWYPVK